MLKLLNIESFVKNLTPVTSTIYTTRTDDFHEDGLFSESIFGPVGSKERRQIFSFLELYGKVIHPSIYRVIMQLDRRIEKLISTEESYSLDSSGLLIPDPKGVAGIKGLIKIFPNLKFRGESESRNKLIKFVNNEYKNGNIFIEKIPVIPPELRPAIKDENGNWLIDSLNDMYINIMRRSHQIRSSGSGTLYDLLNFALQNSVMDHDNFVRSKIGKKQGIIREQMLGKRVDFSGRAVITPGPELKINEAGIPLRMAVGLFEPFIMHRLLYSGRVDRDTLASNVEAFTNTELSVDSIKKILKGIKEGDRIPEELYEIIFEQTEVAMKDRVVIMKRDPVLHAQSYMAYIPILHRGDTILLSTTQVSGHNADFDGDQMAVYHPLTNEAQAEAKQRMLGVTSGTSSSSFVFSLEKEMWVGLYLISKDKKPTGSPISVTDEDLKNSNNPYKSVKYRGVNTTMGKAIVNSCFPKGIPFLQEQTKKSNINDLIQKVFQKFGVDVVRKTVDDLKDTGFKWATIMAPSMNLDSFVLPASIYKIKEKIRGATPEEAEKYLEEALIIVKKELHDTGFGDLAESGATKGWGQPMQILVAKGITADPDGNILDPIAGSFADGLNNREFFDASQGARKGIVDRVIGTADTGYMARKLAYLLNTVEVDRTLKDCRTTRTLDLKLTNDLIKRLQGRYVIKNGKLTDFGSSKLKDGDIINLRSPVFCESPKLCHTCYGKLIERHRTPYVGILAAQVFGERGTQLIMRTFHTGGAVTLTKRNMIEDIKSNDPHMSQKKKIEAYIKQEDDHLITLKPCTITINLTNYPKESIKQKVDEEKIIWVHSLLSKIEFTDFVFDIILDYPINLNVYDMEEIDKTYINLHYEANSTMLSSSIEAAESKVQIAYVERLIGGREILKDASHLFNKLYAVYMRTAGSGMDSVHLEVLVSQSLRDKKDIQLPARLGKKWDPILVNMKKVIFSEGFINGLAFENINDAIKFGLISDKKGDPSIIEKVMTGTLVDEGRGRRGRLGDRSYENR